MRRQGPRAENGPRVGGPKGFPVWPVSICLRLEIIAILSGPLPEETFRRPVVMPFRPAALTPPPTNRTPILVRVLRRGGPSGCPAVRVAKDDGWDAELAISYLAQVPPS
jgi:hypothetical protein